MKPATEPPIVRDDRRLLHVRPGGGEIDEHAIADLVDRLDPGDVLVLNDAATFPASLTGMGDDAAIEIRLVAPTGPTTWRAVAFGAGSWRDRTEDRPAPPALPIGRRLRFERLVAEVVAVSPVSPRLVELRFDAEPGELWDAIYRVGRPVQYAYLHRPLALWSVQTSFGSRPWSAEMPSAGHPLSWRLLLSLRRRGIRLAALTHAAGLSATGDPELDRALPLAERYEIPVDTVEAVRAARADGRRIVAVGTTVVRALESAAASGELVAGAGETELRIDASYRRRIVDGLLTGMHAPGESHYDLLAAFAPAHVLARASEVADAAGFRAHEFGDLTLLLD